MKKNIVLCLLVIELLVLSSCGKKEKEEVVITAKSHYITAPSRDEISEDPLYYLNIENLDEEVIEFLKTNAKWSIIGDDEDNKVGPYTYIVLIYIKGETKNYKVSTGLNLYFPSTEEESFEDTLIITVNIKNQS